MGKGRLRQVRRKGAALIYRLRLVGDIGLLYLPECQDCWVGRSQRGAELQKIRRKVERWIHNSSSPMPHRMQAKSTLRTPSQLEQIASWGGCWCSCTLEALCTSSDSAPVHIHSSCSRSCANRGISKPQGLFVHRSGTIKSLMVGPGEHLARHLLQEEVQAGDLTVEPRTLVTDTTEYPFSAIGILRLNGDTGSCTGALIAPTLVLTAGHCVHDPGTGV